MNSNLTNVEESVDGLNGNLEWKDLDKNKKVGEKVFLPQDWNELFISAFIHMYPAEAEDYYPIYIGTIPSIAKSVNVNQNFCLGGYYYSSSDYGSAWITMEKDKSIFLRHFIYAGNSYDSATINVRYR